MISRLTTKVFIVFVMLNCLGVSASSAESSVQNKQPQTIRPDIDNEPKAYYQDAINKVFNGKDFNGKKSVKAWRLKEKFKDEGRVPDWIISVIEFFERNAERFITFAKTIEVALWIAFICLIIYLLFRYRKSIQQFVTQLGNQQSDADLPSEIFGLDVRRESLPEDIVSTAQKLWNSGESRESFSLLLRGTLSKLIHDYDCQFQKGDTEMDCCQRVAELGNANLDQFMHDLTIGWQQLAYAHQTPSQQAFDSVCQTWKQVFDER